MFERGLSVFFRPVMFESVCATVFCIFACCCLAWISQQAQYLAEVCLCSRGRRKILGDSEFCFSALFYFELHLICVFFCGGGGGGGRRVLKTRVEEPDQVTVSCSSDSQHIGETCPRNVFKFQQMDFCLESYTGIVDLSQR